MTYQLYEQPWGGFIFKKEMIISEVYVPSMEKYLEMRSLVTLSLHLHLCPWRTSIKASSTVLTTPSQEGYRLEKIIKNVLFKKSVYIYRQLSLEGRRQKHILIEVCKIMSGGRWIWNYCLLLFLSVRWRHPGKQQCSKFKRNKRYSLHTAWWHITQTEK